MNIAMRKTNQYIFLSCLLLLSLVLSSARAADTSNAFSVWHPDHFVVSFWCSPPEKFVTVERYQQMADDGFNTVMPICGPTKVELNKKMLRMAMATHLKIFIEDKRMPMSLPDAAAKAMVDTIIADYSHFPSLAGYFLVDEPSEAAFPGLGQVMDYLRLKDPAHPVYVNLFPGYPGGLIGKDYDNYLKHFIDEAHPWFLSYDHYHFTTSGDGAWWFENLEAVARISKAHDMPFFNIVLATQHLFYRKLTEAEKRFEAMQTLAFGAHGLLWFTYWQPDTSGMWKDAIINYDGTPTYQYEQVKRINHDMAALGNALLHAECVHAWTSNPPGSVAKIDNPQAKWTVSFFKQGSTRFVFLANQDYKNPVSSALHIQTGGESLERFDLRTEKFVPIDGLHLQLDLGPADAALYRWKLKNF